jgi:hypothetical protein
MNQALYAHMNNKRKKKDGKKKDYLCESACLFLDDRTAVSTYERANSFLHDFIYCDFSLLSSILERSKSLHME